MSDTNRRYTIKVSVVEVDDSGEEKNTTLYETYLSSASTRFNDLENYANIIIEWADDGYWFDPLTDTQIVSE